MVTEFNGFRNGVIGKDLPSDTTLMNMRKSELVKLLHTAQHNYDTLMRFYSNAVDFNMKQLNNNGCTTSKEADLFKEQNRWIPVEERLPKESGRYIADNGIWIGEAKFDAETNKWDAAKVKAWRPLPESYVSCSSCSQLDSTKPSSDLTELAGKGE